MDEQINSVLKKYRSIKKAKLGELKDIRNAVLQDKDYLPTFHIHPKTGLLNDPNGLVFDGKQYHIFYQWYPFDSTHGMKHWAHLVTKDFITFDEKALLIPEEAFETHGCYSGGALIQDEELLCFYTGNTKQGGKLERVSYQNVCIYTKDGSSINSKHLVTTTPKGYTEHVRDPKPWFEENGQIKFICGAQRVDETGTAILFDYDHETKTSKYIGELTVDGFDNTHVFMWECPDLLKIQDKDVFIWCPQGLKPDGYLFNNNYSCTYAVGYLGQQVFKVDYLNQLDHGFDFYAPQTFSHAEETLLIGWIGLPDATYPSDVYKWQGALTLPRVLSIKENKIYQKPHQSIYKLINPDKAILGTGIHQVNQDLSSSYLKSTVNNQAFTIDLFVTGEQKLTVSYKEQVFTLDRTETNQTDFMKQFGSKRCVEVDVLQSIEIFIDHSIIEIYINEGEYVLTGRFFIEQRQQQIKIEGNLELSLSTISPINLPKE